MSYFYTYLGCTRYKETRPILAGNLTFYDSLFTLKSTGFFDAL